MEIIKNYPSYIPVYSSKKIHGWYPGKRECTSERILLNPYVGCEVGCFFCYAYSYPGRFQISRREGIIFVYKNFVENLKKQIEKLNIAFCGYLSPVSEPFQGVEKIYHISTKTIELFVSLNIPVEFITKEIIPDQVIELIEGKKHCFGQISILTDDENLRKKLMKKGANTENLFRNIEKLAKKKIFTVCRIDPIIPFITDDKENLKNVIKKAAGNGAKHIIASIMDIPTTIYGDIIKEIRKRFGKTIESKIRKLYVEKIGSWYNAKIDYRKEIFTFLRNICDKEKVSFALCMEYEEKDGKITGLNKEFMSSENCEGINIPVYFRKGKIFFPGCDCNGNCLNCIEKKCGIDELAQGRKDGNYAGWKYSDYLRWSKIVKGQSLF